MKITKADIKARLDEIEAFLAQLSQAISASAEADADADKTRQKAERLDAKKNKTIDDLEALSALQRRMAHHEEIITRFNDATMKNAEGGSDLVDAAGLAIEAVLSEIVSRRLETVTCALLPFSADRESAALLASKTDICRAASAAIGHYRNARNGLVYAGPERLAAVLAQQAEVLKEALKTTPDLLRFLAFTPAEATSANS